MDVDKNSDIVREMMRVKKRDRNKGNVKRETKNRRKS